MATDLLLTKTNFRAVDLAKYIAAIMVICVHCDAFFELPINNFILKSIICRVAVPFFFIATSYFVRKGIANSEGYLRRYLTSMGKSYLVWSVLFAPLGLLWISTSFDLPSYLYPVALGVGLLYTGTYYHLWFIPALFFALVVVNFLIKRVNYAVIFVGAGILYILGTLETYNGILAGSIFANAFDSYAEIFITTRNGLFMAPIFVVIGFFAYDSRSKLKKFENWYGYASVLCSLLLLAEGVVIYGYPRADMNFLIMLVPFSFVFFQWLVQVRLELTLNYVMIRGLSKYYFFIHPMFIFFFAQVVSVLGIELPGLIQFAAVILCTHTVSTLLVLGTNTMEISPQIQA